MELLKNRSMGDSLPNVASRSLLLLECTNRGRSERISTRSPFDAVATSRDIKTVPGDSHEKALEERIGMLHCFPAFNFNWQFRKTDRLVWRNVIIRGFFLYFSWTRCEKPFCDRTEQCFERVILAVDIERFVCFEYQFQFKILSFWRFFSEWKFYIPHSE